MARSVIGLDVGTTAVRAAEVRFGRGRPALVRFAQVALAPGAVVAGEVVDASAVAAAIRRLWKEGGFKGKRVVTGVAGQRVVARTTELPAMSDDDLRSSLPFQAQDLIPIPMDESVLDHQVLERLPGTEDEGERLRVLVVAAHRDVVRSLLAALEGAGLVATRVDLIPFALVRALHEADFAELGEDGDGATAEAIVDVGGGVTNVVVHEHGVPRLIRSLSTGGVELTEALVTDLDVDFEEAEALKRRTDDGEDAAHARQVLRAALVPVLEEIRSSLDFWEAQSEYERLRRVVVTGGVTRIDELATRLEQLVGAPVLRGDPFARVDASSLPLDGESKLAAASVGSVAIGLALSGEPLPSSGRRVSLLPAEIVVRERERRQVAVAAAAVAGFAAILMGLYTLRANELRDAEDDAAAAEARTDQLRAELAQLRDVEALEADIATRRQTVSTVLDGDVEWTRLVQEIATVLPSDVWITSFQGDRSPGEITVTAMGFDQTSTARWLLRLEELASLDGLWVPSSTKTTGASRDLVTFTSNATLTPAAQSDRVSRYVR